MHIRGKMFDTRLGLWAQGTRNAPALATDVSDAHPTFIAVAQKKCVVVRAVQVEHIMLTLGLKKCFSTI